MEYNIKAFDFKMNSENTSFEEMVQKINDFYSLELSSIKDMFLKHTPTDSCDLDKNLTDLYFIYKDSLRYCFSLYNYSLFNNLTFNNFYRISLNFKEKTNDVFFEIYPVTEDLDTV